MVIIFIITIVIIVIIKIMIAVDHLGLAKCLPVAHNTTPHNSITIVIIVIIIVIKLWLYSHVFLAV